VLRRLLSLALLAGAAAGGWYFFRHYQIVGLEHLSIRPRDGSRDSGLVPEMAASPGLHDGETIRIASFNIQVFGEAKLAKSEVTEVLVEVFRRFDLVAVQEIRSKNQGLLPDFVRQLNAEGGRYDFVLGERQGRTSSKEQYAFVFDTRTIEVDPLAVYSILDRDDLLHRGPPPESAFTFTLINVHTDPDETGTELDALDDVYRSVRNDGRGEDDIILLGDLNVDEEHLGQLGQISGIRPLIVGTTTNTRRTKLYDNILLHAPSTTEFTGRAGVFDLESELGLSPDQAQQVSDHLPIWAEFSIHESAGPHRVATGREAARAR